MGTYAAQPQVVETIQPAPVTYAAPPQQVTYAAAPQVEYIQQAPVTYAAPQTYAAPAVEYIQQAPVTYAAAPAVTESFSRRFSMLSRRLLRHWLLQRTLLLQLLTQLHQPTVLRLLMEHQLMVFFKRL